MAYYWITFKCWHEDRVSLSGICLLYKSESPFIITSMYLLQLKDEDFINFEANLLQFREK